MKFQSPGPTEPAVAINAQLASQSLPVSKISRQIVSSAAPIHAPHPFQSGRLVVQSKILAQDSTPDEDREQSMLPSPPRNSDKALAESATPIAINNKRAQAEVPDGPCLESTMVSPPKAMVMIQLCLNKRDKSRRFLRFSPGQSLLHLSMHGFIDKVHLSPLRYSPHI